MEMRRRGTDGYTTIEGGESVAESKIHDSPYRNPRNIAVVAALLVMGGAACYYYTRSPAIPAPSTSSHQMFHDHLDLHLNDPHGGLPHGGLSPIPNYATGRRRSNHHHSDMANGLRLNEKAVLHRQLQKEREKHSATRAHLKAVTHAHAKTRQRLAAMKMTGRRRRGARKRRPHWGWFDGKHIENGRPSTRRRRTKERKQKRKQKRNKKKGKERSSRRRGRGSRRPNWGWFDGTHVENGRPSTRRRRTSKRSNRKGKRSNRKGKRSHRKGKKSNRKGKKSLGQWMDKIGRKHRTQLGSTPFSHRVKKKRTFEKRLGSSPFQRL